MDAIFPALIGVGLWFCYEAWTNPSPHPVAKALHALGVSTDTSAIANAPYTGGFGAPTTITNPDGTTSTVTLPQGTSVAGGGTDALHG